MYINKNNKVVFNFTNTKYDNRYKNKIKEDAYKRIAISPFPIKENYNSFINYDGEGNVNLDNCVINCRELFKAMLPASALNLLLSILPNLEENTNILRVNLRKTKYSATYQFNPCEIMSILCDRGIIFRTDTLFHYIINHNIIFKGDLNKFRKEYLELYGNDTPLVKTKGKIKRIILKHS